VRQASVAEICHEFSEADRAKIEMWKWVKVTRQCGKPLAVGYNCAGYVVQPPAN
jgi:hypothetical protein